ncbi:MAG: hypothetical protein WBK19_15880 [Azonexus sp.]
MQLPHAPTVPIDVVRELFSAMSGETTVGFDEADFAALPPLSRISTSCVLSRGLDDIDRAVEMAWPNPAGSEHLGALVVVRANGMEMARYREIARQLHRMMPDKAPLFLSISQNSKLPKGSVFITILAVSHPQGNVAVATNQPSSQHHSEG